MYSVMLYDHHILDKEETLACFSELKRKKYKKIILILSVFIQDKTKQEKNLINYFFPEFSTRVIMFNF